METHDPCFGGFPVLMEILPVLLGVPSSKSDSPATPNPTADYPSLISVGSALVLGVAENLLLGETLATLKYYPSFPKGNKLK